jgi:hypothetical protein
MLELMMGSLMGTFFLVRMGELLGIIESPMEVK